MTTKRGLGMDQEGASCARMNDESVDHQFVHCPYTAEVWVEALKMLKINGKWVGDSIFYSFKEWYEDKSVKKHRALPCTILWAMWLSRNDMLAEKKIAIFYSN
jgi:hypothetical protein